MPTVLAASPCGIPTIVHEQNALLGRANRLLASRAGRIATAFATVAGLPEGAELKPVRTGMPVRPAFARLRDRVYQPPEAGGPIRLLVLGGSQGARVFGEVLPAAVDRLNARLRSRLAIAQQCRPEALGAVEDAYRRIGISVELASFFDDVPQRLANAHLLIARAGASTIAELTALGCPAVLVPYPFATDDHQSANAGPSPQLGGGWLMPQESLTAEALAIRLEELLARPDALATAAAAAKAAGVDRAAAHLAELVMEVIGAAPTETHCRWDGSRHEDHPARHRPHPLRRHRRHRHERHRRADAQPRLPGARQRPRRRRQHPPAGGQGDRRRHRPRRSNLGDAQVVVISSAVKPDNPEVVAARKLLIPVVRRAEMLGELMRLKWSIAVGGTHGKTTTTSLIAQVLDAAGLDPTVVNGGIINAWGSNARHGSGDWMVAEADESDGTMVKLPATIAVITNIDPEHLDHYGTFEALREAFVAFAANIPFYGVAALCIDHPEVQGIIPRLLDRRVVTYGFSPQADVRGIDVRANGEGVRFSAVITDRKTGASRTVTDAVPADVRPAQRPERAGGARRRGRGRHRRRRRAPRLRRLRRRQPPLHPDRRGRRHHRHRRLRPPSGRDRRGAGGGADGRPRARSSPSSSRTATAGWPACSRASAPASTMPTR